MKTGTVRMELILRLDFMCIFSPLSNTVCEWMWMWRMSECSRMEVEKERAEQTGCGNEQAECIRTYMKRVRFLLSFAKI